MRDIPRTAFLVIVDLWVVAVLMLILSVSGCATTPANFGEDAISGNSPRWGPPQPALFNGNRNSTSVEAGLFEQC